jgi:hypothetical protein
MLVSFTVSLQMKAVGEMRPRSDRRPTQKMAFWVITELFTVNSVDDQTEFEIFVTKDTFHGIIPVRCI